MAVGRKPKPTALKKLEGSPHKARMSKREPKIKDSIGSAPRWFTKDQREDWNWVLEHAPRGLLKSVDTSVLETWVVARDIYRRAVIAVNEEGMVVLSPEKGVPMQSPHLATVNKQALIMMKAAAEMGFTPASRTKVTIDNNDEEDPSEAFFG